MVFRKDLQSSLQDARSAMDLNMLDVEQAKHRWDALQRKLSDPEAPIPAEGLSFAEFRQLLEQQYSSPLPRVATPKALADTLHEYLMFGEFGASSEAGQKWQERAPENRDEFFADLAVAALSGDEWARSFGQAHRWFLRSWSRLCIDVIRLLLKPPSSVAKYNDSENVVLRPWLLGPVCSHLGFALPPHDVLENILVDDGDKKRIQQWREVLPQKGPVRDTTVLVVGRPNVDVIPQWGAARSSAVLLVAEDDLRDLHSAAAKGLMPKRYSLVIVSHDGNSPDDMPSTLKGSFFSSGFSYDTAVFALSASTRKTQEIRTPFVSWSASPDETVFNALRRAGKTK